MPEPKATWEEKVDVAHTSPSLLCHTAASMRGFSLFFLLNFVYIWGMLQGHRVNTKGQKMNGIEMPDVTDTKKR